MSAAKGQPGTEPVCKAWSFHRVLEIQKYRQSQSERHTLVANNFNFLHRLSVAHIGADVRDHLTQVSDEMRSRLHSEVTLSTNSDKWIGSRKKPNDRSQATDATGASGSESSSSIRRKRMTSRENKKRLKQRLRLLAKCSLQSTNEQFIGGGGGGGRAMFSLSFDSSTSSPFAVVPSVIIVGTKQTGKSTIIRAMQECHSAREDDSEVDARRSSYSSTDPLFIEVNCQKDDLWPSITTHAFVIVFSTDKADSQARALECLGMLRTRQSTCNLPIFLVVNMVRPSCEHVSLKEPKNVAARYNTPFMKISPFAKDTTNVETLTDWLYNDLYNPCPFSSRKDHHRRTTSGGQSILSPRRPIPVHRPLNRRTSRSCEDLLLLHQKLSITK